MNEIVVPARPQGLIVSLRDEFSEYQLERLSKIPFELFIYDYGENGYGGSGFAIWKNGDKYGYQELGHCSCNGPLEDIETSANVSYTFEEVSEIAEKYYSDSGSNVIAEMKRRLAEI